jgi:putative CocE/NonD family hydrolase
MDKYQVDYSTTLSVDNRHTLTFGGAAETAPPYAGMALNDRKGLTYSTSPLVVDTEVTGYAVAHLWVSTTAEDGDFFVHLAEVLPDGTSRFVSDGMLRASHRKLGEAPYDNLGLPYHPSNAADIEMLTPNEPVELVIELSPTSRLFKRGNRIRVTITCADANTFETPIVNPVPEITLYRSEMRPSRIVLPIIR